MCGRFTLRSAPNLVAKEFELPVLPPYKPRWNIAPTQQILAVRLHDGKPEATMLRWGLIPAWAEDIKKAPLLINAKSETAATKPSYRSAFKRRRCLVVADGYYEWRAIGKKKQPYYHRLTDERPFAFAGLWERWEKGEKPVESCTILTTDANSLASAVHDRMPVILPHAGYKAWLDPEIEDVAALQGLLCPYPAKEMTAYPVNPIVNKAGNEGPECIAAVKVEE
jgi:putative SOS response-associated peptidase YedK